MPEDRPPAAEFAYTGVLRLRPPMSRLLFDVRLRNTRPEARWFLLPYGVSRPTRPKLDVVETYVLGGTGRLVVGHLGGLDGMYAVLLPAGADVRLRRLPLLALDEPPEQVSLDIAIAPTLLIGDQPAADWFGMDPLGDARADVDAFPLRDQGAVKSARHAEGDDEETVTYPGGEHELVRVALRDGASSAPSPRGD